MRKIYNQAAQRTSIKMTFFYGMVKTLRPLSKDVFESNQKFIIMLKIAFAVALRELLHLCPATQIRSHITTMTHTRARIKIKIKHQILN